MDNKVSDDELLNELRRVSDVINKSPTMEEFNEHGKFAAMTISRRFDGWNNAKRKANLAWYSGPGEDGDPRKSKRAWYKKKKVETDCFFCGEDFYKCLDFHHKNKKKNEISKMLQESVSIEEMKEEAKKCVIVCANCHRKLHSDGHPMTLGM